MGKLVKFNKDVSPYGNAGDVVALSKEQLDAVDAKVKKYKIEDAYTVEKASVKNPENARVEETASVSSADADAEVRPKRDMSNSEEVARKQAVDGSTDKKEDSDKNSSFEESPATDESKTVTSAAGNADGLNTDESNKGTDENLSEDAKKQKGGRK